MKDTMKNLAIRFKDGGGKQKNPEPPDTEVDDVETPDAEEDETEEELSKLFGDDEDDDDEEEEETDEEELEEPDEEEPEETDEGEEEETEPRYKKVPTEKGDQKKKEQKTFTEDEVNSIVQDRLARKDRQFREQYGQVSNKLSQLEQLTGMDADGIITHVKQAQVKSRADEWGISEEEANRILESEQKAQVMEKELGQQKQQNEQTQRMVQYDRDKQKSLSNPLVKKYEKEIDEFSQNGAALNFEPAMKYVLGQAMLEGKVDLEKDMEQKVLAERKRKKKGKTKPESGGSGGGAESYDTLSKQEKQLARNLGLSVKEYQVSKKRLDKQKKVRGN